jgi:hypothetical protein
MSIRRVGAAFGGGRTSQSRSSAPHLRVLA